MKVANQKGQMMIESMLLLIMVGAVFTVFLGKLKETKAIQELVTGPWHKVAGMAEFGSWNVDNDANRKKHPNNYDRFFTPKSN